MAAKPSNPKKPLPPFYITVTPVKEGKYDVPLVTLPPGTVLFRGVKIPNVADGQDARYFYRDFIGTPEDIVHNTGMVTQQVCLPPIHNVFFYPFPFIAFGVNQQGERFHSMQAVVLVHPMTVICNVSPSPMSRGATHDNPLENIYDRCDKFDFHCHPQSEKELDALAYDNCLHPEYQQRSGVRGWMAIANQDSLFPGRQRYLRDVIKKDDRSSMSKYIHNLEQHFPGKGTELIAYTYKDSRDHVGFPEVALYPYRVHPGPRTIVRKCASDEDAIMIMVTEAERDNLNYLPLAAFTKEGIVDMVNGQFDFNCIPADSNTFATAPSAYQSKIEEHLRNWMNHAEVEGLDLPYYGKQQLKFDSRTGFFVLSQMVPRSLTVPVPKDTSRPQDPLRIPYAHLLLPLKTEEERKRALDYMILFRSFFPAKAFTNFGLDKGVRVRRAMIFERPPFLEDIFTKIDIPITGPIQKAFGRAKVQYQINKPTLTQASAFLTKPNAPQPKTFEFNESSEGGSKAKRKTRSKKLGSKRITRRASKKDQFAPLKMFHKVWKAHVANMK